MSRGRFFPSESEGKKNRPLPAFVRKMLKAGGLEVFLFSFTLPVLSKRGLFQIWRLFNE